MADTLGFPWWSHRCPATAAIISSLTSTCRRHGINPQAYLTQLLIGLQDTPISQLDRWLPNQWKKTQSPPPAMPTPPTR